MDPSDMSQAEAERQVTAAIERYRELVDSMGRGGRPESGQRAAEKAVGRALQLLSFVLKRAVASGVSVERLSELTEWEPELVHNVLERPPAPEIVSRLAPSGLDASAVARAAAGSEASVRLHALTEAIRADIDDGTWSPAAADLDELHDRLETAWRSWRQELRGTME
jgi:hypothetical protein